MNLFTCLRQMVASLMVVPFLRRFSKRSHNRFLSNFLSVVVDSFSFERSTNDNSLSFATSTLVMEPVPSTKSSFRSWMVATVLILCTMTGAFAQLPNVAVKKTISNSSPNLGDNITYTITVTNSSSVAATGVELTDVLPSSVNFLTYATSTGTYSNATGIWSIGTVPANTSVSLSIATTVKTGDAGRGLAFSVAEITKQTEANASGSVPGNGDFQENDIDAVCFSVPLYFYTGDEYHITPPTGYSNVVWYKKVGTTGVETPVTATTTGVKLSGDTLIIDGGISDYTEFTFTAAQKNCPANACCPVKIMPGLYGSIGNYVWFDTNSDGKQDASESGIDGVKVYLYASDGVTKLDSTFTSGGGKYLFDSLFSDTYYVKFVSNAGNKVTSYKQGADDSVDSDADPVSGLSPPIVIDVEGTGKARDNMDIDAGLVPNTCTSPQTVSISPVSPVCYGNPINLIASGTNVSTYTWTTNGSGTFTKSITGATTTYSPSPTDVAAGSVTFTVTTDDPDGASTLCSATSTSISVSIKQTPYLQDAQFTACVASPVEITVGSASSNFSSLQWYGYKNTQTVGNPIAGANGKFFTPSVAEFPTSAGVYYYAAVANTNGCIDTAFVQVTVNATPTVSIYTGGGTICLGQATALVASSSDGSKIYWYTNSSTTLFAITNSNEAVNVSPAVTETYYAEVKNGTCVSPRSSVVVVVAPKASTPIVKDLANNCPSSTVNLADAILSQPSSGGIFEWHVTSDVTSALVSNTTTTGAGKYYLFEKTSSGCYSTPAVVTVTINNCQCTNPATVTIAGVSSICGAVPVQLTATLGGGATSGSWTTMGTGTFSSGTNLITTYTPSASDLTKTSIEFTYTTNDPDGSGTLCTATSTSFTVVIKQSPNLQDAQFTACVASPVEITVGSTSSNFSSLQWYGYKNTQVVGNPIAGANGKFFTPTVAEFPTAAGVYYYAAIANENGCSDTAFVRITVNAAPTVSIYTGGGTICLGQATALVAHSSDGSDIYWYTNSSTTPFAVSKSDVAVNVSPAVTETYYAEVKNGTCVSPRSSAVVVVAPKASTPIVKNIANNCPSSTVSLADAILSQPSSGGTFEWHVTSDVTSAVVSNTTTAGAGKYYLFEKTSSGCYSSPAVVTVTINNCQCTNPAAVTIASINSICKVVPVQLTATLGGGATSGSWTTTGTGTFSSTTSVTATYTPSVSDLTKASIEFTFTTNDPDGLGVLCNAVSATGILQIKANPIIPVTLKCDKEICLGQSNKLFAVSPGNTVYWYDSMTGTSIATADDNGYVVTPTVEGSYTYYAKAVTPDGCESVFSSITFIVKKCLTDLTVTKDVITSPDALTTPSYLLGQKITYSIVAENLGTITATSVKVTDILPSSLTYVSSTPAGQYNATTGEWIIGTMTGGSSKVLLVEAIVNKVGTIHNEAVISSPDEDPTKLTNNKSTKDITATDIADLSLTKTVSDKVPVLGSEVEYTITVTNAGPNTATNVAVKDVLPAGLEFVSSSTLTNTSGVLTATVASILKDASVSFKFKAKVSQVGSIINKAEVSKSDQKDPDSTPGNGTTTDEDDDDNVEIQVKDVCSLTAPVIACGVRDVCYGDSITFTATGCATGQTVVWNTGAKGSTLVVAPLVSTTFTAYCEKGTCRSSVSNAIAINVIKLSAPTLAGPSQICDGSQATLTASSCDGVVQWQTSPSIVTGNSITVSPKVTTTYYAVCKVYGCTSPAGSVTIKVIETPAAPELVCNTMNICPGQSTYITAMNCDGQVKWNTGQTTTIITVSPLVTTSYTATCTVDGCESVPSAPHDIVVTPIPAPTVVASATTICTGTSVKLDASNCLGKVTWNIGGGQTMTGASITVKPTATTVYSATCSSVYCSSEKSVDLTITVANPAVPTLSSAVSSICAGASVDLTAASCTGDVVWSNGATGAKITVNPTATTSYTATCKVGACQSATSDKLTITVTEFAKPSIYTDNLSVCAGGSITLNSNGCNGTVVWSDGQKGTSIVISPSSNVKYTATCESTTCKSDKSNELAIVVTPLPAAPVVSCPVNTVCAGTSVTLTATGCTSGTIKWSNGSTGSSIAVSPTSTTTYNAKCTLSGCESVVSNEKTITVTPTVPLALSVEIANPTICSGTSTTLTLKGCEAGTITWSSNLPSAAIVTVSPTVTTIYSAVCSGVACAKDASISTTVTVIPSASTPTIVVAGMPTVSSEIQVCSNASITLTASNCNGSVLWSTGETATSITVSPTAQTSYSVKCIASSGTCSSQAVSAPLVVKVGTPARPTIKSSVSDSTMLTCSGGQVTLTASGCGTATVVWSNGKTGTSIVETINSTTSYTAVCKQDLCSSDISEKITIKVTVPSVPTITCASNTICAGSKVSLVAVGCEGTVKWSDGFVGTINDVSPNQTTDYTAKCIVGQCESSLSAVATVNVGTPSAPVISCNASSICSGIQITLAANNCAGTVIWSDGQVGSVITASPKVTTAYTAICKLDKCQSGVSNKVTVSVSTTLPTPVTKDLVNVCPFKTVDLTAGVTSSLSGTGNVFEFHTGNTSTSPLVTSPSMVAITGTYYVFEKTGTGCYSSAGAINVYINENCSNIDCVKNPATVDAGSDQTLCAEKVANLSAKMGGAATSLTWSTTGTGTFDNPLSPVAVYRSSLKDVIVGFVKLVVTTNDPDGSGACKAATDTVLITINGIKFKPTIATEGNLNACGTDSVKLTAVAGYEYKWFKVGSTSVFATTQSVMIKGSNGGRYYYKLVDKNRCCSIESDTVTVNPLAVLDAPVVIASAKINKGQTINLTNLVSSATPTGASLVFKVGNASSSNTVANPSAVGAGTYYAYYNSAQGCFSVGSKLVVEYNDGTLDGADVLVTITTDKSNYVVGDTVTTTITVKNIGNLTAKGIKVSSQLPSSLTYLAQVGALTYKDGMLSASLDSLIKQGSKVYTYKAIVNTKGATTIPANVSATNDISSDNNTASVAINSGETGNGADLALLITSDKATVEQGGTVTITMKLTNNGPATAKKVSLKNTLPAGLTFVSSADGLTIKDSVITIALDSLVKSEKVYTYVAKVSKVGSLSNAALVSSSNDPNTTNNGSIVVIKGVDVSGTADIDVNFTATKQVVSKDDEVTFTISVKNKGPKDATDVSVKNLLPKNLTYVSANDGLAKSGDTLMVTIPTLANGATKVYTYVVKVAKDTIITNTVRVTKSSPVDPVTSNNSKTLLLVPMSDTNYADLAVTMTSSKVSITKGDAVTFFVTLKNNGGGNATNIVLQDYLPSNFDFVSSSDFTKTGDSTLRTAVIPSMAKGASATYSYIAKAKVVGTVNNTVAISKSDIADLIADNNSSTVTVTITDNYVCKLGLAMKVVDTVKVSTGVYNIKYRLLAKNFCTDTLKNVTLTDSLANNFKSPATYELVGSPVLGKGSLLAVNPSFGATDPNIVKTTGGVLLPGVTDTVTYVVKVTLNGVKSFTSQAQVTGMNGATKLTALSSDGVDVNAAPSKTTVRFDLPQTLLGVAKELVSKTKASANVWTVTYKIKVVNMGSNVINKVSVKDNLDSVFTIKGATVTSVTKSIVTGASLKLNANYTGSGLQTELLDSTSTLAKGDSGVIQLVVGVNTSVAPDSVFSNVAIGYGVGSDKKGTRDVSTKGTNPDPDDDKDPSNNNEATSVTLDAQPASKGSLIGLALKANTPVPNADSTVYNVTYTVRAVNMGSVDLKNVNITNDIQTMLGSDVTSWSLVGKPTLVKGTATIDTTFAGSGTKLSLTNPAKTTLAKGDTIVISYQVKLTNPLKSVLNNQANGAGLSKLDTTVKVTDVSTNGVNPDPNGDGKPLEQDVTPISVKATVAGNIVIPQGFSPNGDGNNDTFVISGVNKDTEQVELQIFNRWGSLVFASDDYLNTWDGKSNQGIKIISDGISLPEGTYFYVVTVKDRATKAITSTKARYLTLMH